MILRPYQRAAIDAIYSYFAGNTGHPLVVIPTAGGKSLVMAVFIKEALERWPGQRILIVTHVRELISQNHRELMSTWPDAPAGIFSAGLGKRDLGARVLFAGIQSIHGRAYDVQRADLVLVDEAHLIPRKSNTTYRRFLTSLTVINPRLKVIGFTATPFRLDSGMLHQGDDALFTDIAYEVSVRELIDQGYLCPLISKPAVTELDVTGVGTRGGEFVPNQLQSAVDRDDVTRAVVEELLMYGASRKSWLIFCSGVEHAQHVAEAIEARGFSCATVFGDTPDAERDRVIAAFKAGEIRALVSMGVLTTGFNAPGVDLVAMLRPTKSTGLYIQIAGRGTRLCPGKSDCLVLDFAGNIKRHGPIDAVKPRTPGNGGGDAPIKICPECNTTVAASARGCSGCGYEFPAPSVKITPVASELPVLSTAPTAWLLVSGVSYRRHEKPGRPPSLRVEYRCGLHRHREWVCLEHDGYARQKATAWWRRRAPDIAVPATVGDALTQAKHLRVPNEIAVRPDGKFMGVVDARFS